MQKYTVMKKMSWAVLALASGLLSLFALASNVAPEQPQLQDVAALSALNVAITVHPSTVSARTEATYHINYSVSGSPAPAATLVFSLPEAVINWDGTPYTYTALLQFASGNYARHGHQVTWSLGTVQPGTVDQELVIVYFPAGPLDGSAFHARAAFGDASGARATADAPPVTIRTNAAVGISKDPRGACAGQAFDYTISVGNSGTSDLFDVVLQDRLPPGLDFVTATVPFVRSGSVLTWTLPHLPASGARWFYVGVRAGMEMAGTTVYNTATVSSAQRGPVRLVHGTTLYGPEIRVEKWWPTYIRAGDTFTYCARFYEPRGCPLNRAALTETVPAGLTVITATVPHTRVGNQVTWSPAFALWPYRLTVQADSGLANGTLLTDVVRATAPGAGPGVLTATAWITDARHLVTAKSVRQGAQYSDFYIDLVNPSTNPLTNLDVVDRVPASAVFDWASAYPDWCNPAGVTIRVHTSSSAACPPFSDPGWLPYTGGDPNVRWIGWHVPSLANQSIQLSFGVRHSNWTMDIAENVATYTSDQVSGTVTATYRIPVPLGLSSWAAPDRIGPEKDFWYYISYENSSGITATGVSITSTLPPTATFVSADNDGQYLTDTHQVIWELGTLAHGHGGTVRVTVRVLRGILDRSRVCHQATLGSNEFPTVGPVEACVTAIGTRAFQLIKDTRSHLFQPGDAVTYRLTYVNLGDVAVCPLNIWDRLPDEMTFVAATTPSGERLWFSDSPAPASEPPPVNDLSWVTTPLGNPTWLRWERSTPALVDARYPLELVLKSSPSSTVGTQITNTAIITGENLLPAQVHHRITIGDRMEVYLPLVLKMPAIDLTVRSLTVEPPALLVNQPVTISLVIENRGNTTTSGPFWVDLYIDPDPALMPPQVNQTWDMAGSQYGLAWLIEQPVAPGQQIALTSLAYNAQFSDWPGSFNSFGTHLLYAQVDSFNGTSPFAAVQESNENNNTIGPVPVPVSCPVNATASCVPLSAQRHARGAETVPPRPSTSLWLVRP